MPSSPPTVSPFSLLPPLSSPSYTFFCPPHSLGLCDVAFDSGRFCRVTWHGQLSLAVGDVAFDGGVERRSLAVGDMPDVVRPHPSMSRGAVVVVCRTRGPSKGGDVATVRDGDVATVRDGDVVMVRDGDGDVAWLVGVGVGDEHALA